MPLYKTYHIQFESYLRQLKVYFKNTYDSYESLFTALEDDSVYLACPDRLRLPLIFYYGHTAAVYVNKLVLSDLIKVPFESFDFFLKNNLKLKLNF